MSEKRSFYLTRVVVEVLSEDEPVQFDTLDDLNYAITEGGCSGSVKTDNVIVLDGKTAAKELQKQGSDPEFFRLDEDGNDLED